MEAIDPAAKMNCATLRTNPTKVPGVPQKSFIFLHQIKIKSILRTLRGKNEDPSSDCSQMHRTNHQRTQRKDL
ncbi:HNH endonuclease [Sesbania bispinosa]|nr:HNH endonuclease [Sesbania bispinosa]